MALINENQVELFGISAPICEYYPVLLPDGAGLNEIVTLNRNLISLGLKPSQLTKLPHISIDGVTCPENDDKVIGEISAFLSTQNPISIEFSGINYFPGRGGITLILGVENQREVLEFNSLFMPAIHGKVTKLKQLHLTLARYVSLHFDTFSQPELVYPKTSICSSAAILKKIKGAKGAYENIGIVKFGL